ncbi:uncharacterized protein WCC33_009021 [Rhinophrynus dorsalis]
MEETHCFKSHSHLMSLSLLLLLAAGDISPNPGPPSILSWTTEPTHTRNTHNLITVPRHLTSSPPFCFGLWNARSVCNKLTAVHDLFISHSLNLLAITETWLTSSDTASTAALSYGGLQFTHTPRPGNRQGGGVGILLPPNHIFQVLPTVPSLSFPTFETHTLRLFSPLPLRVAVIYRPPGPTAQFLDHFTSWLPHFMSSDVPTLIMGDFNIPIDNHNTPPALKLLSLTTSLGLSQRKLLDTVENMEHGQERELESLVAAKSRPAPKRVGPTDYKSEEELKKLENLLVKKPNQEILDHGRKRKVELKCLELDGEDGHG